MCELSLLFKDFDPNTPYTAEMLFQIGAGGGIVVDAPFETDETGHGEVTHVFWRHTPFVLATVGVQHHGTVIRTRFMLYSDICWVQFLP